MSFAPNLRLCEGMKVLDNAEISLIKIPENSPEELRKVAEVFQKELREAIKATMKEGGELSKGLTDDVANKLLSGYDIVIQDVNKRLESLVKETSEKTREIGEEALNKFKIEAKAGLEYAKGNLQIILQQSEKKIKKELKNAPKECISIILDCFKLFQSADKLALDVSKKATNLFFKEKVNTSSNIFSSIVNNIKQKNKAKEKLCKKAIAYQVALYIFKKGDTSNLLANQNNQQCIAEEIDTYLRTHNKLDENKRLIKRLPNHKELLEQPEFNEGLLNAISRGIYKIENPSNLNEYDKKVLIIKNLEEEKKQWQLEREELKDTIKKLTEEKIKIELENKSKTTEEIIPTNENANSNIENIDNNIANNLEKIVISEEIVINDVVSIINSNDISGIIEYFDKYFNVKHARDNYAKNYQNLKAIYNKGLALFNLGNDQAAIQCFLTILKIIDSSNLTYDYYYPREKVKKLWIKASQCTVDLLTKHQKFETAIDFCNNILCCYDSKNIFALHMKGQALIMQKKYEDAMSCYEILLDINPENISALNWKAHINELLN